MARANNIAVNLLLIVAVTMQPSLAYGLGQGCSTGISSAFTCQGCGCCTVESETASCGCCSSRAPQEESGCCVHGHQNHDHVPTLADDPFAGMELQKGPVLTEPTSGESSQPRNDDHRQVQVNDESLLSNGCHCVTAPKPFDAPAPRSPGSELRDELTVSVDCVCDAAASGQPLSPSFELTRRPVEPHFSQIAFCVWRL